jgi:hypothetical protein
MSTNYKAMDCKRRCNPNFGMAVKVDPSANKVIKNQVLKMKPETASTFWENLNGFIDRQKDNLNNIVIRKTNHRNALAAEVVDAEVETAVKNKVYAQGIFSKNGSLKFMEKAEEKANNLKEVNEKVAKLPEATKNDFYSGGILPKSQRAKDLEEILSNMRR